MVPVLELGPVDLVVAIAIELAHAVAGAEIETVTIRIADLVTITVLKLVAAGCGIHDTQAVTVLVAGHAARNNFV